MNREKMLMCVRDVIAGIKKCVDSTVELGVFTSQDVEEYTWSDMLYENTGVDIESEADLNQLSDDDLAQIISVYR